MVMVMPPVVAPPLRHRPGLPTGGEVGRHTISGQLASGRDRIPELDLDRGGRVADHTRGGLRRRCTADEQCAGDRAGTDNAGRQTAA
ncbi:hypothetical protein JDM601_2556 [Mycolicibacter sinensis]|uniref:Uncharacterized protein n=1 Tax=Mycolicibacter sinensis (strain JDM601) TaxID=875328 RepID=F5YWV1_MYCSD|nr:hypothetical protein JDM601_2556 [Mycolicibacter sinensis]